MEENSAGFGPEENPPAVNVPAVIVAFIGCFVLVQVVRGFLSPEGDYELVARLGFVPMRYWLPLDAQHLLPGGLWAAMLGPFTHAFVHSGWLHLAINSLWLMAFGAPVARRLGGVRFTLLMLLSAAAGALFYLGLHWGERTLLIGASGGVSGMMGAAIRLIFAGNATLSEGMRRDLSRVRPLTIMECLALPRPRVFILVWMGINLAFGVLGLGGGGDAIAWEAHVGGFLAGLVLLSVFDRPAARREARDVA